jgi:hypothetical protein
VAASWRLESLDDRWGPPQNRGLNRYPCWSWVTILSLHILKLSLQKRFGGLNLEAPTGVALTPDFVETDVVGGWTRNFLARHSWNEDANLAVRSDGGSEQVAVEISFMSSRKIITGANCHHATQRARDHPYLACQLSDGEIWTAHGGVNPCGLVVRRGDREQRTRWLC